MSPEARELLPRAAKTCTRLLTDLPDGGWGNASPCEGWTVRDVVNHLTAEHLWAKRLLSGATLEEVGDAYSGDMLGEAPVDAWRHAAGESLRLWASADLDREITMSAGPVTTAEYANQMLVDLTVHAWDIATGAGVTVWLDPECVEACLAYEEPKVTADGLEGLFAAPVATDSDHPRDRLLALLGRDPKAGRAPAD